MTTKNESKSKYRWVYDRIIEMPPMTVISIEHLCPLIRGAKQCELMASLYAGNSHGFFKVRSFHVGNDLYVVALGE